MVACTTLFEVNRRTKEDRNKTNGRSSYRTILCLCFTLFINNRKRSYRRFAPPFGFLSLSIVALTFRVRIWIHVKRTLQWRFCVGILLFSLLALFSASTCRTLTVCSAHDSSISNSTDSTETCFSAERERIKRAPTFPCVVLCIWNALLEISATERERAPKRENRVEWEIWQQWNRIVSYLPSHVRAAREACRISQNQVVWKTSPIQCNEQRS